MAEDTPAVTTGIPFLHLAQLNKFREATGPAAAPIQIYNDATPVPDNTIRLLALSAIAMIQHCLTKSRASRMVAPDVMKQLHHAPQRYLNAVARMTAEATNFVPHTREAMAVTFSLHQ